MRFALGVVALALALPTAVSADQPPHLVLKRPQASCTYTPYSRAVKVVAQPYPYGYFGAGGFTHWQLQHGVNQAFTQVSQK
jgi:hypothetical protein